MRAPMRRSAGRTSSSRARSRTEMFASLDWVPTLVDIAGGPKGDELKKQIEAGSIPGIVKTTLDGVNQLDYLDGKSEKSARDTFFYYSGATPSAVRYKNWKFYYTMSQSVAPAGWIMPLDAVPLDPGPEHQARSLRDRRSGIRPEDAHGHRRRAWPRRSPPSSTTGTCCRSASCCG